MSLFFFKLKALLEYSSELNFCQIAVQWFYFLFYFIYVCVSDVGTLTESFANMHMPTVWLTCCADMFASYYKAERQRCLQASQEVRCVIGCFVWSFFIL